MPESNRRTPTLLLVEDSEDDAFFFRWTLRKCGLPCEMEHVADGAAAIAYLEAVDNGRKPRPDLMFLDLKLPMFSGFDVLKWIGERKFNPPLHVVVVSGSEHASDFTRAEQLGAAGYIVKPISVGQLRERLEQLTQAGVAANEV